MIKKYCDRCNKDMGIVYSPSFFSYCGSNNTTSDNVSEEETMNVWTGQYPDKMRMVDLCEDCHTKVYDFIFKSEPVNTTAVNNEVR